MNIKNKKGISLLVLTITIIVLIIVTSVTVYKVSDHLSVKNLNYLYSDIDSLETKVFAYYNKTGKLPVFDGIYINTNSNLQYYLLDQDADNVNPNDYGAYYVIDLYKLDNLTLNYGKQYKDWGNIEDKTTAYLDYKDLYIINTTTMQIYYPKGILYNDVKYYSKKIDKNVITPISIAENNFNVFEYEKLQADTGIIVKAKIHINSNDSKLKFAWSSSNNSFTLQDSDFSDFELDENGYATLESKIIPSDTQTYYIWVKFIDENGSKNKSVAISLQNTP